MLITTDLTGLIDDKTVLRNPHKGWYWHYFDNGMKRPLYRDKLKPDEDYKNVPGLNHLYLRIDWSDIQPSPYVFDWSKIDSVMEKWGALGYTFSFRVCCSETCEAQCFATPKWLYDMGCKGTFIPPSKEENPDWWETRFGDDSPEVFNRIVGTTYHRYWEPDYGDPLFLKYLELFLENFAEKYDNDPRVEFIDLGSYGNWGEGHVCFGTRKSAPIDVLKKHAFLHAKYFKNKYILMNDDFITHLYDCTKEQKQELYSFCKSLHMGIRDDSILAGDYEHRPYHTIDAPEMFDDLYTQAPVDLELGHYRSYTYDNSKGGLVITEAARRGHATYAGFHTYPEDYLKDNLYVVEYLANRLGYWYAIHSIAVNDEICSGAKALIKTVWENMGFAPSYNKFIFEVKLTNIVSCDQYTYVVSDFDNRNIMPGKSFTICSFIDTGNISEGRYSISIRLRENSRPILIALCDKIKDEDGFYKLCETTVIKQKPYDKC